MILILMLKINGGGRRNFKHENFVKCLVRLAEEQRSYVIQVCCQQTCMTYTIAVCTVKKTLFDGQRKCPKHVEFH
jgi:hypothetical protein